MKQLTTLFTFLIVTYFGFAQDVTRLIGSSPFQDSLWVIDTTSNAVTRRLAPSISGFTVTGINGIAKHPTSGSIYTISKVSGVTGRVLGKFNLLTGEITQIGNLGQNFSSITFKGDSLFGVTGNGSTNSETCFLIDTLTGVPTLFRVLGNGADGEVISYNPDDNMIYHWSGNGTIVFEKFSPDDAAAPVIDIPIIGTTNGETFGALYIGNNNFRTSNISSSFNQFNAAGNVLPGFGSNPDDLRGMAMVTCQRQIAGADSYCVGDSTELSFMGDASSYQWTFNGSDVPGATNPTFYAAAPGDYAVRISDACGVNEALLPITVAENALPVVSISGPTEFCSGSTITLTSTSVNTNQWYLNGALLAGETLATITVGQAGTYNMIEIDTNGCADSTALGYEVVENLLPAVSLSLTNSVYCPDAAPETVTVSPAGGILAGTGITGTDFNPVTAGSGIFDLTYEFTDTLGCTNYDTISVEVAPVVSIVFGPMASMLCTYNSSITLDATPVGGTFSGTGVTGASFNPSTALVGTNTITYNYTDGNGCDFSNTTSIDVDSCLSIGEFEGLNWSVYPNPTSGNLTVSVPVEKTIAAIVMMDLNGKLIKPTFVSETTITVSGLSKGVYVIEIELTDATKHRKSVIIE